ncbi:DNA-binding XRE family transcriptional regulator [Flavobacterium arsenatis]|uniref:DNA-binding XRE family transcriptional regulator n=1 Tax=Flavobacterium arsenatis TaxID=1484332 RepID=A0ABU1TLI5_9FLAO|nr:helix-turn-helix transcriptional regulator [Flavobacterium arsenatis]MDR6966829.1 DNA-binding XRE family transcriptional regulator [Flavobacterium arsenatis]
MFGKNLKKIRSVHGISQQEFADIFDLKRGTLGAYEEERSNPKLETVLKIANHFSIGIEELLTKELTVNRLLKFNEKITTASDVLLTEEFKAIPCVLSDKKNDFAKQYGTGFEISKLPVIRLPYVDSQNRIAFSVDDLAMTGGSIEFFPKDIVIGIEIDKNSIKEEKLVITIVNQELVLRKLYFKDNHFILKADHHGVDDIVVTPDEITAIWKVEHIFHYSMHSKEVLLENRLAVLEQSIASLKK